MRSFRPRQELLLLRRNVCSPHLPNRQMRKRKGLRLPLPLVLKRHQLQHMLSALRHVPCSLCARRRGHGYTGRVHGRVCQGPSQQVMNLQTRPSLVFQLSFRGRIWGQLLSTRGQESTQVDVVHVVLTEGDDRRHGQGCAEGSTVIHVMVVKAVPLKTPLAL